MSYVVRQSSHGYHLPHGLASVDHTYSIVAAIAQAIWLATGVVIELLAVRFMLAFLGANPATTLFHYIYSASQPIVNPFIELAHKIYPSGNFYRLEIPTLVAIALYALIGYGIAKLLTKSQPHI